MYCTNPLLGVDNYNDNVKTRWINKEGFTVSTRRFGNDYGIPVPKGHGWYKTWEPFQFVESCKVLISPSDRCILCR